MKLALSIVTVIAALLLGVQVSAVRVERAEIKNDPAAATIIPCNAPDVHMRQDDCQIRVIAKDQVSLVEYQLLQQPVDLLWLIEYVLAGFVGAVAAFWLHRAGLRVDGEYDPPSVPRILLGGFAGGLTSLLLKLPAPAISGFLAVEISKEQKADTSGLYSNCLGLAVLAGLFLITFFSRIKKRFGGDSHAQADANKPSGAARNDVHDKGGISAEGD